MQTKHYNSSASPAGVFREPSVQARRAEAVPDAGHPGDGAVRAVEDGPLQKLHAQRPGRPGGQDSGTGASLDTRLQSAEVRRGLHTHTAASMNTFIYG